MTVAPPSVKPPRSVLDSIYAFPPNRETLGGTAYLLIPSIVENSVGNGQPSSSLRSKATGSSADTPDPMGNVPMGNVLVDCPAWNETYAEFLRAQGGVRWLVVTHRGGSSRVKEWQQRLGCEVVVQEQEAYLLPGVEVSEFRDRYGLNPGQYALWTPGHSPGSTCVYTPQQGGVLFTGRHLLPNRQRQPVPLRLSKTFHWPRQLRQVQRLRDTFSPETLSHICPGASTGFLRGQPTIERAYEQLQALDLEALRQLPVGP